ncbi:MAG: succinate dehydrogenase flavoprotein subunit [Simkaniaceae bacterium]|nr:succinate dehydrogenase flavoprotein subunit [Simkaniaceae bacterium]
MVQNVKKEVIVVGGGLGGLSTAMKLAELGCHVKIVSVTHVKRSHSVCAQGGVNAAMNMRSEHDSPLIHAYETIKGGDFLANQPPVVEMCLTAPKIIQMFDRFGCTFNRSPEGGLDFRRFGGTFYNRTAFAGSSTGQQMLYSLDEQVRRFEALGQIEKFEHHEFMRLVIDDDGLSRGIVMMNLFNLELMLLKADAVVIATGGLGYMFKATTNSTFCTGAANARLYMQGMKYANGEFIQIHPTAIPGYDKLRLMTETLRGGGGRIWVYGDSNKKAINPEGKEVVCGQTGEPWYFLEEFYPDIGNLVPRDIAAREIVKIVSLGLGIDGQKQVYLDVRHFSDELKEKYASVLEIYRKFTGEDPSKVPMKIFPGVHYSMGGAWVDWPAADDPDRFERFRQMTNIRGCFAVGEADYQYHGANRLGGNSLMSCVYGGLVTGIEVNRYLEEAVTKHYSDLTKDCFEAAVAKEQAFKHEILSRNGDENIHLLHDELAHILVRDVTVVRNNKSLEEAIQSIKEIKERYKHITLDDKSTTLNQTYVLANQFKAMLELSLIITKGALLRNEFRGSHYKPEFPNRDDDNWLKTTIAEYDPKQGEPKISYEPVDLRHVEPVERKYVKTHQGIPEFKNMPINIELPI